MTSLATPTRVVPAGTPGAARLVRLGRYLQARPWLTWMLTRAAGMAIACTYFVSQVNLGTQGVAGDVLNTYLPAHLHLAGGLLPYRDFRFEYPPGALPFLYLPGQLEVGRSGFLLIYMGQMLVLDAIIHRMLQCAGGPTAKAAADLWLYGGALTAGLLMCRNDLPACAAVIAGLLALQSGRTCRAAALLGLGAVSKVWPAELLVLLYGAKQRWLRGAATAGGVVTACLAPFLILGATSGLIRDLIGYHGSRGVEIEAVAALPQVVVAAVTLRPLALSSDHGSLNLAHSGIASDECSAMVVLVAAAAVAWLLVARRRGAVDLPRLALLACWLVGANLLVTKVLSPQYMLWLLAVTAVGVQAGAIDRRDRLILLGTILATTLEFPFGFFLIGQGSIASMAPATFLLVRDCLLVWLVVRWTTRLLRPPVAAP